MRKHVDSISHFAAIPMQELAPANRPKKAVKTTTLMQPTLVVKPTQPNVSTTRVKALAWEAYMNELEFE